MPYITDRIDFDNSLESLMNKINTKGELEYCIYKLMKIYIYNKEWRYSNLHDTVYAAQHCADEFRRNYLDRREDNAKKENGKIHPLLIID